MAENGTLEQIPLAQIKPSKLNPRKSLGDVSELAESMKHLGLIEPIVVVRSNGHFELVAGERRLAAAKLASLETLPAIVREFSEDDHRLAMLIENLQREGLTALEEASAYQQLLELGLTQRDLAGRVGRSQGHVSKRLALLELPAAVRKELDSGGITLDDARELSRLAGTPKRLENAFKKGRQWGSIERAVRVELKDHALAEKIGKAEQQLKQKGVKFAGVHERWQLPKGALALDSYELRRLKISAAGHESEPCHAVALNKHDGSPFPVCTNPRRHKDKPVAKPESQKEAERKEREREKQRQLKARETNVRLGEALTAKLAAPKIDAHNMRLLADLLMREIGAELAQCSFRFTDEASQTVITRKDGSVSRIAHVEGLAARKLIDDRLARAKTPEEIMGVILQALVSARYANRDAVPPSQRFGHVPGISSTYGPAPLRKAVEKIGSTIAARAGARA